MRATTAILTILLVPVGCASCSGTGQRSCGFSFEANGSGVPADITARLSGPLTREDLDAIERTSREALQRAFADFHLSISDDRKAFWRVRVVNDVTPQSHGLPGAGESLALGPLGGIGFVDFDAVAFAAVRYAPDQASRQQIVDAIGRGIGRVAAHELGHQILGAATAHDKSDENAYEYGSPERRSQYYGDLHWTTWRAPLARTLGR